MEPTLHIHNHMTNLQILDYTCPRNTLNFILLLLLNKILRPGKVPLPQVLAENVNRYQPKLRSLEKVHASAHPSRANYRASILAMRCCPSGSGDR